MSLELAILASGNGGNAQSIWESVERGALDARIRLVFSNQPGAKVLERARRAGIPHMFLEHGQFPTREAFDHAMAKIIREHGADTIALAGYMRLLSPGFVQAFKGRVVNIHPSLLPAFAGARGISEALDWGVTIAGCTVHFVDEEVDHGEVIIQAAVPCQPDDTPDSLRERIHGMEHRIFPQALQWLATGRITISGRHVTVREAGLEKAVPCQHAFVWPPLEAGF